MISLPNDLFLMCLPSFEDLEKFSDFLALRLVDTRFNHLLNSSKLWESLSESQIASLCKLLSEYWVGMRNLKLENPSEEINKLPLSEKYSIPAEIKRWLVGETRITLTKLIKEILVSKRKRLNLRRNLLKESLRWDNYLGEEISREIEGCKSKLEVMDDLINNTV